MRTPHVLSAITLAVSLAVGAFAGASVLAQDSKTDARVLAQDSKTDARVLAQDAKADARTKASARLSIAQVHAKMTALGYADIDQIEREHNRFEVDARTSAGERVKLYVDAHSGEILRAKTDAGDRGRDGKRADKEADRGARDRSGRRCRDDARARTLPSETVGWYLSDIYGRMKAAGI